MIYSIGKNLGNKLTGIEQAMINRLKLFKDNLVPNKLIHILVTTFIYACTFVKHRFKRYFQSLRFSTR